MRMYLVPTILMLIGMRSTPVASANLSMPTAGNTHRALISVEVARPLDTRDQTNCVVCSFQDNCSVNEHVAWVATGVDARYQGAHSNCLINVGGLGCGGHPDCSIGSAVNDSLVRRLALRVLDGDRQALIELADYPGGAKYDPLLHVVQLAPCPRSGAIYGMVPADEFSNATIALLR
jgi:hypothetical protein